jgi:competence protein ComEC
VPASIGGESSDERLCVVSGPFPTVTVGDVIRLQGDPEPVVDAAFGSQQYLRSRGCQASMFATSVDVQSHRAGAGRALAQARDRFGEILRHAVPGDAGVLLTGLVTGDDNAFSAEREAAFVATGTTHLTAVSGSNMALVAGIFATVGASAFGRHRRFWLPLVIVAVWAYALITGAQPPAVRAALVVTAAALAIVVGRRPDFVTLILLAAGLMVLIDPGQIDSLGFRLSVAASLALAYVLSTWLAEERASVLAVALAASAAAQIATLPFLLPIFGTISLISVPANMVVAPLAAVAMPLAMVAALAGVAWQPLSDMLAAPAALVAMAVIRVVDLFDGAGGYIRVGMPPTASALLIGVTCLSLIVLMGRQR